MLMPHLTVSRHGAGRFKLVIPRIPGPRIRPVQPTPEYALTSPVLGHVGIILCRPRFHHRQYFLLHTPLCSSYLFSSEAEDTLVEIHAARATA